MITKDPTKKAVIKIKTNSLFFKEFNKYMEEIQTLTNNQYSIDTIILSLLEKEYNRLLNNNTINQTTIKINNTTEDSNNDNK